MASPTEEATASKRHRLTTTTGTLTSPLPSLSSCDSLNAPTLPSLPFELITEILCRLPVKFLLQFKCVCNSWKSLISDPKFVKKHLHVSTTRPHLIFTKKGNYSDKLNLMTSPLSSIFTAAIANPMQFEYAFNKHDPFPRLVGSCNGILCFDTYRNSVLLFNPSIGKFKLLPKMKKPRKNYCDTLYGFGYDHVSDDYKVVVAFGYHCDSSVNQAYETLVNVYTLSTNSWRRIQDFPFGFPFGFPDESGKFVSGTVNWLVSSTIVSLNLGNESYEEILQPDYGWEEEIVDLTLAVLRDCLCVLCFYRDTFCDIWIMKEYGNKESWTKLFAFPYTGDLGFNLYTKALYASEDGRILLESESMDSESNTELALYDSRDFTFPTLEIQNINFWGRVEVYIESLVSPCF